jgi:hypothetical protein
MTPKKAAKPEKWIIVGRYIELDAERPYTTAEVMDYAAKYNAAHAGEANFIPYALAIRGDSIVDDNQHPEDIDNFEVAIRQRGHNALSWQSIAYASRARGTIYQQAKCATKARGHVRGLTLGDKALVDCDGLVYFIAPYRGHIRLYLVDSRGTWRAKQYFARRPFAAEVERLMALGAAIPPHLCPPAWPLPGDGAEL